MSSTKFAFKELPKFTPPYYRQWASVVKDAFAERDWNDYLVTPESKQSDPGSSKTAEPTPFVADPSISARAKAFLSQSIDFKYQPSIESCKTAAEIWTVFLQRYGTKSREDELRLEAELLSLVKLSTETLDEFIERFDNKISAIRAQQELSQRWDDHKINMHYLRSLEYSKIEDEDWKAFVTYLGNTWLSLSNDSLQANTRIYYTAHIEPYKRAAPATERLYAINTFQPTAPSISSFKASQDQSTPNSGRGRGRGNDHRSTGRGKGGDGNRGGRGGIRDSLINLPRDKNAWCTTCERPGHAASYCYNKYKDSGTTVSFTDWCASQLAPPPPPQYTAPTTLTTSPPAPSTKRPSKEHAHGLTVRACRCNTTSDPNTWIYDTACTEHMTDQPLYFTTYDAFETPIEVHGIGGLLNALGQGKVILIDQNDISHAIDNVWYVPGLGDSIISKYWTKNCGLTTSLDQDENFVLTAPTSSFTITTTNVGKMSVFQNLKVAEYTSVTAAIAKVTDTSKTRTYMTPKQGHLMHERLAHPSADRLRLLGINYKPGNCQVCVMAKQTLKPFPTNKNPRVKHKLERIYSDLCYVSPESFGHGQYFIVFVDELTRYVWVYIIPNKTSSTILQVLKKWLALVQNQSGTTLINFRTDGGGEYTGETLKTVSTFLDDKGVTHEQTSAHSSSSNGVAERMNRTLMDMVRAMMIKSGLPAPFWAEALHTAARIRNRLPTSSLDKNISPHEAWFGVPPTIDHFRIFGCIAYGMIQHPKSKVFTRSRECCLLGYEGTTQYRLYDPIANKILSRIRNVTFFEDKFLDKNAFINVPYADRPLQVPEPRNYTELDEEFDVDDMPDLFPDMPEHVPTVPMPAYMPPQQPASETTPRAQPRWPIPMPRLSTDLSDSDSDADSDADPDTPSSTPSLRSSPNASQRSSPQASPMASPPASSPASEYSTPQGTPPTILQDTRRRRAPKAPTDIEPRRSGRATKPTKDKLEGIASKSLVTHSFPTLASTSPFYTKTFTPPKEPRSVQEALSSLYAPQWTTAINKELNSLLKKGTYEIVRRPRHQKVIGSKFAFKTKDAETDTPTFKARFVAKGYTQIPHIDFEDTFAPVAKATSVRLVLAHAAGNRLLVNHFDVETAFLNSDIDRVIYIEQPIGFEHPDYPRADYVWLVKKGIYGLKQAGCLYANDQKSKLIAMGFTPSDADECVFISADKNITVTIYVDDGLVCAPTQQEIDSVITSLSQSYTVRNLGVPTKFLGLDISRPDPYGPITVSQSTYARKLLAKFGMEDCNPVKSPCDSRASHLHLRTETETATDAALYRSITSSIMHLSIWTRPDISWITNKLCQFNKDPSELHMSAVKHLLRYIKGTLDYSFTYKTSDHNSLYGLFTDYSDFDYSPLHGYSDASGASDPDDRCSTSGYIYFYYNAPIAWGSRKQTYAVALSTMESEYLALTEAAKEAQFLRRLLASINFIQNQPTLILTDSDSALRHIKNNVNHPRSKHIDTRHHYIRFAYNSGDVDIRYIPAASQTADILTKPLGTIKHLDAVKLLQLHDSRNI
jgi:hypothetical protein